MRLEQLAEGREPHSSLVLAGLADPDGNVVLRAEIEEGADRVLDRRHPVFVEGVGKIGRGWRAEEREIRIPIHAGQADDVVRIHGPHGLQRAVQERLNQGFLFFPNRGRPASARSADRSRGSRGSSR